MPGGVPGLSLSWTQCSDQTPWGWLSEGIISFRPVWCVFQVISWGWATQRRLTRWCEVIQIVYLESPTYLHTNTLLGAMFKDWGNPCYWAFQGRPQRGDAHSPVCCQKDVGGALGRWEGSCDIQLTNQKLRFHQGPPTFFRRQTPALPEMAFAMEDLFLRTWQCDYLMRLGGRGEQQ